MSTKYHVLTPVMLRNGIVAEPGSEIVLTSQEYLRLSQHGCVETIEERDARANAEKEIARIKAQAEASARKQAEKARAEAEEASRKARAEAQAKAAAETVEVNSPRGRAKR